MKSVFCKFLTALLLLFIFTSVFTTNVSIAFAASFTPSVSPGTINAGELDVLLNFTVDNTNAVNITMVNITLPSGFAYSGGSGTSASGTSFLNIDNIVSWPNTTAVGIVAAGTEEYFWFKVDSPGSTGNFDFNVSTSDINGVLNSQNVSLTVADQSAPKWSNYATSPASPVTYAPGKNYTFNITWTDNIGISEVKFEWNGTTNYTNATTPAVESLGSNRYGITLSDLAASNYTYKWYANDSSNLENSTSSISYKVKKSDNELNMYFNDILNQDQTITNGTDLNVTVTGRGSINLYENDALVGFASDSLGRKSTLYSTNKYNYTATVSGNANYTANSSTYFVMVVPNYTVSTSIVSEYSSTTKSIFNISFSSPPGFSLQIEGNWSGSVKKYTMTNISSTALSYTIIFPAGSFYWKIYGNYSDHIFDLTTTNSFTVNKGLPSIGLDITPAWTVPTGIQTNVSCVSDHVSVKLYRNDSSVSNPEVKTFGTGDYVYNCNNTATANYSYRNITKILTVKVYISNLTFTQAESLIVLRQNSSNTTIVKVKNTGDLTQNVTFTILDLESSWYTINATNVLLLVGRSATFLVTFNVGAVEMKDHTGRYKAYSPNATVTSSFVLRVLPTEEKELDINVTLMLYRVNMTKVWAEINDTKVEKEGINVTLAEQKISEAKQKIELSENYVAEGKYFDAYQLLDDIETLIAGAEAELAAALESYRKERMPDWVIWSLVGGGLAVAALLLYLLWPQPGYDVRRRRYRYKTPRQRSAEKISEAKEKLSRAVFGKPYITRPTPAARPKRFSIEEFLKKLEKKKREKSEAESEK